jgi:predicted AAA+ superfamily ATPase
VSSREEVAAKSLEDSLEEAGLAYVGVSLIDLSEVTATVIEAADAHDRANGIHRIAIDDATVQRAARAARSYTEDWCVDFAEVIELGPRFDEHMEAIARAVLATAVKEEQA